MSDREIKPDDTTDSRIVGGCLPAESRSERAPKQGFTLRPDETTSARLSLDEVFAQLGDMDLIPYQLNAESLAQAWILSRTYLDDEGAVHVK